MQTYTLSRTGHRPLTFTGEKLAEADNYNPTRNLDRYFELAVYRTRSGRYVVSIALRAECRGEGDIMTVVYSEDPAEIERALRDYDPCPPGIGFPPGESFVAKQDRLREDMRRKYDGLVTELFAKLGESFAEVLP